jgi:hypothetical protein
VLDRRWFPVYGYASNGKERVSAMQPPVTSGIDSTHAKAILVYSAAGIRDAVMAFPLLQRLRELEPTSSITVCCPAPLRDLWQRTGLTALLITHDLEEALLLAGTVHILAPSPGRIVRSVCVELDHASMAHLRVSPSFLALREELAQTLRSLEPALPC